VGEAGSGELGRNKEATKTLGFAVDPRSREGCLLGEDLRVKDLVFELVLIVTIIVPVVATSMQPIRAMDINRTDLLKRLRRRG
jgi:hypothetical protein